VARLPTQGSATGVTVIGGVVSGRALE
jgi:hypothetical protein